MFDFHHHNRKHIPGIYNLSSKSEEYQHFFSAGLHPWKIDDRWQQEFDGFRARFKDKNCLAIGECGLDAMIAVPDDLQKRAFIKHIEAANEVQKPLIIHCVRRYAEVLALKKLGKTPWIIHGFNKNEKLACQLLENGFYLSFGKALLQSLSLQKTFVKMPADRFFIETDDAETDIFEIYKKAAELRNTTPEMIQYQTVTNLSDITYGARLA